MNALTMLPGQVVVQLQAMTMDVHAQHGVDPAQFEPGHPLEDQAREHSLDFLLSQWTATVSLVAAERAAVELNVPFQINRNEAAFLDINGDLMDEYESIHHRDETLAGIGDARLGVRYRLRRAADPFHWTVDIRGGLSLPTGHTEPDPFLLGSQGKDHQHMFFGSGVYRPNLGFIAYKSGITYSVSTWGNALVAWDENRHGYKPSDVYQGGLSIARPVGVSNWSVRFAPEFYYESVAQWTDTPSANSGRFDALAGIGASWSGSHDWSFDLLAKTAVYSEVEGGQLDYPGIFQLRITRRFTAWEHPTDHPH